MKKKYVVADCIDTSKIYKVYENDEDGRLVHILGFIRANSEGEAREEMSLKLYGTKDTSLVNTGYYRAYPMPDREYRELYEKARKELAKFDRNLL